MIFNSQTANATVPSPCNNECKLGPGSICTGCYRTIGEITGWGQKPDAVKREILEKCAQRKAEAGLS